MDNDKVYPKSQVYSHVHKSAFQTHTINNSNSINGKKHMYEIGT